MAIVYNPFIDNFDYVGTGGAATPGGTDGAVQYNNGGSFGGVASAFYFDDINNYVGINQTTPTELLDINGDFRADTLITTAAGTPNDDIIFIQADPIANDFWVYRAYDTGTAQNTGLFVNTALGGLEWIIGGSSLLTVSAIGPTTIVENQLQLKDTAGGTSANLNWDHATNEIDINKGLDITSGNVTVNVGNEFRVSTTQAYEEDRIDNESSDFTIDNVNAIYNLNDSSNTVRHTDLNFLGATNSGWLRYDQNDDWFEVSSDIYMGSEKWIFRNPGTYLTSTAPQKVLMNIGTQGAEWKCQTGRSVVTADYYEWGPDDSETVLMVFKSFSTNDGVFQWDGNNDRFNFNDDVRVAGDLNCTGKLTVGGLIDPTGLVLTPQGSAPSTTDGTVYYNTTNGWQFRENGAWIDLSAALNHWQRVGTDLSPTIAGDTVTIGNTLSLDDNTGDSPQFKLINQANNEFQMWFDTGNLTTLGSYGNFEIIPQWQNLLTPPRLEINGGSLNLTLTVQDAPTDFVIKGDSGWDPGGFVNIEGGDAASGNNNGGNVRVFGGAQAGSGNPGNVVLAHDGTSPVGKLLVGTSTPISTELVRILGYTRISDGVRIADFCDGVNAARFTGSVRPSNSSQYDLGSGAADWRYLFLTNNADPPNAGAMTYYSPNTRFRFNEGGTVYEYTRRSGDNIGDASNYSTFASDGTLSFTGTAKRRGCVCLPATLFTGNAATYNTIACSAAGGAVVGNAWAAATFDATTPEAIIVNATVPTDYIAGDSFAVNIAWAAVATTGVCRWQGGVIAVDNDEAFNQAHTFATPVNTTVSSTSTGRNVTQLSFSGTGVNPGSSIAIVIFRDAGNGADTMAGDAYVANVGFIYLKGAIGDSSSL